MMIPSDDAVRQAVALAGAGKTQEAREALINLVKANEDNLEAWAALAQLVDTPQDATYCLKQILRIQPDNEWARDNLYQLSQSGVSMAAPSPVDDDHQQPIDEPKPVKTSRMNRLVLGGAGVIIILGIVGLLLIVRPFNGELPSSPSSPTLLPVETPSLGGIPPSPNAASPATIEPTIPSSDESGSKSTQKPGGVDAVTPTVANAGQTPTPTLATSATLTQTPAFTPTDYPTPTDPPDPQDAPTDVAAPIAGPCDCYGMALTCGDFDTQAEAQACYAFCLEETSLDIFSLDTNNNDQACEELP